MSTTVAWKLANVDASVARIVETCDWSVTTAHTLQTRQRDDARRSSALAFAAALRGGLRPEAHPAAPAPRHDRAPAGDAPEFYDRNDLALHNELAAQSAQLEKTVVFSSEARQEAADAALGVAVDPARLGRGGRYVDPDVAQQFAWTFFQG